VTDERSRSPIAPGDFLANGRYRVEHLLGEGGMGVVCAAEHVALGQQVAIKFLLPEALEHPHAVARFEREARASASLTSEHVVRVTDVGTLETGAPYFVMEFLEGEDLAERLRREGPLGVRPALALMGQACEGLIEAHSKGLVHRDIKPSNLFLARRASGKAVLKVIDFGIAKVELTEEAGGHDLTRTSEIMGSPQYMSPEQLRDTKNVDARTDLWSLGAAFYECLTGRPPFTGATMTELVVRIATEDAPRPTIVRPDLPAEVEAILQRCLAKRLDDRFASASELLDAIESLRGSATLRVASVGSAPAVSTADESGAYLAFDETSGPLSSTHAGLPTVAATPSTSSRTRILAVALAAAVAAGIAVVGLRSRVDAHVEEKASPAVTIPALAPALSAAVDAGAVPSRLAEAQPSAVDVPIEPSPLSDAGDARGRTKVKPGSAQPGVSSVTRVRDAKPAVKGTPAAGAAARKYDPGFE
jgi:serine/threonine protein kinase